jgi:hypothetical protein
MSGTRQEAIAIATALLNTYIISNNNKLEVTHTLTHDDDVILTHDDVIGFPR